MKPLFDFDGNGKMDALELLLVADGMDMLQNDNSFDDDESESDDIEDYCGYLFDYEDDEQYE